MQDQDILGNICIYLDDEAIFQLYFNAGLRQQVQQIFSSNLYWKLRSEHLVGKRLDFESDRWAIIYYSLVAASQEDSKDFKFIHGLHDLDSMKVIELVYDFPKKISILDSHLVSPMINSREVLDYFTVNYQGDFNLFEVALQILDKNISTATLEQVRRDLGFLQAETETGYEYGGTSYRRMLLQVLTKAAARGDADILRSALRYTIEIKGEKPKQSEVLAAIASGTNLDSWQLVVKLLRPRLDKGEVRNILERLEEREDVSGMGFLVENKLIHLTTAEWRSILNKSIERNKLQVVKYLLTIVSPVTDGNQALKKAAVTSPEMFQLVLSDSRISLDSLTDIIQVVLGPSSQVHSTKDTADRRKLVQRVAASTSEFELLPMTDRQLQSLRALLQDDRVEIDDLSDSALRLVLSAYGTKVEQSIILETLDNLADPLVRYIAIKRPSKVELLDWMIESKRRRFAEAADLALSSQSRVSSLRAQARTSDKQVEPVRVLLYSLLHPTASVEEILLDVDENSKQAASLLLNLHQIAKW